MIGCSTGMEVFETCLLYGCGILQPSIIGPRFLTNLWECFPLLLSQFSVQSSKSPPYKVCKKSSFAIFSPHTGASSLPMPFSGELSTCHLPGMIQSAGSRAVGMTLSNFWLPRACWPKATARRNSTADVVAITGQSRHRIERRCPYLPSSRPNLSLYFEKEIAPGHRKPVDNFSILTMSQPCNSGLSGAFFTNMDIHAQGNWLPVLLSLKPGILCKSQLSTAQSNQKTFNLTSSRIHYPHSLPSQSKAFCPRLFLTSPAACQVPRAQSLGILQGLHFFPLLRSRQDASLVGQVQVPMLRPLQDPSKKLAMLGPIFLDLLVFLHLYLFPPIHTDV